MWEWEQILLQKSLQESLNLMTTSHEFQEHQKVWFLNAQQSLKSKESLTDYQTKQVVDMIRSAMYC